MTLFSPPRGAKGKRGPPKGNPRDLRVPEGFTPGSSAPEPAGTKRKGSFGAILDHFEPKRGIFSYLHIIHINWLFLALIRAILKIFTYI